MRIVVSGLLGLSLATIIAAGPSTAFAQRTQQERALPRAAELVEQYRELVLFCAPCGDVAPGVPFRAEGTSEVLMRGQRGLVVLAHGRELPLQSTYVRTEPGWYRNLAVLLDVPAPGAAPSLRVENAGTTGELISVGSEVREPAPNPEPAPPAMPANGASTPAGSEPPVVIVHQDDRGAAALALLALGISGVAGVCMLWILFVLRLRRRRSMRPRALHLRE